eukprot:GHVU01188953.1.p1 GENE.GHVU01188953.1~~GHVU01188953.1.p1  ORF type:complete len:261 (+),score=30.72 GHVU01188953.1:119-784(+)
MRDQLEASRRGNWSEGRGTTVSRCQSLGCPAIKRIYEIFLKWENGEFEEYFNPMGNLVGSEFVYDHNLEKLVDDENIDNYFPKWLDMLRDPDGPAVKTLKHNYSEKSKISNLFEEGFEKRDRDLIDRIFIWHDWILREIGRMKYLLDKVIEDHNIDYLIQELKQLQKMQEQQDVANLYLKESQQYLRPSTHTYLKAFTNSLLLALGKDRNHIIEWIQQQQR